MTKKRKNLMILSKKIRNKRKTYSFLFNINKTGFEKLTESFLYSSLYISYEINAS